MCAIYERLLVCAVKLNLWRVKREKKNLQSKKLKYDAAYIDMNLSSGMNITNACMERGEVGQSILIKICVSALMDQGEGDNELHRK